MPDAEKQHPTRRTSRSNSHDYDRQDDVLDEEDWEPIYEKDATVLPANGLSKALGVGIAGGLAVIAISLIFTLLNTPSYQEATRLGDKMSIGLAYTLFWLNAIMYLVELLTGFIAGFIVGRIAVKRLYGFYAGMLVGAVAYIGSVLLHYIPGYPGTFAATTSNSLSNVLGGILFLLIAVIIRAIITGLLGLWGVRISSNKHPYYKKRYAA